jgi:hypothetical protein
MNLPSVPIKGPSFSPDDLINVTLNSATGQAILLAAFVFFMLALVAMSRRYLIHSSLKGVGAGLVIGMLLLGIVEAAFFWGFKAVNTGENISLLPRPVQVALSNSQDNLTQVLGAKTERAIPTAQSVVSDFNVLPNLDAQLVQDSICKMDKQPDDDNGRIE